MRIWAEIKNYYLPFSVRRMTIRKKMTTMTRIQTTMLIQIPSLPSWRTRMAERMRMTKRRTMATMSSLPPMKRWHGFSEMTSTSGMTTMTMTTMTMTPIMTMLIWTMATMVSCASYKILPSIFILFDYLYYLGFGLR